VVRLPRLDRHRPKTMSTQPVEGHEGKESAARRGLYLAPFDDLAHPGVMVDLARRAEAHGWDGVFLWDRIAYPPQDTPIADVWVTLSAIATATENIRLGPMVTPIPGDVSTSSPERLSLWITSAEDVSSSGSVWESSTISHHSARRVIHGPGPAYWTRASTTSSDCGPASSSRVQSKSHAFQYGWQRAGHTRGRFDARPGGTGCFRSISPGPK
jgi:hypothetical protein